MMWRVGDFKKWVGERPEIGKGWGNRPLWVGGRGCREVKDR